MRRVGMILAAALAVVALSAGTFVGMASLAPGLLPESRAGATGPPGPPGPTGPAGAPGVRGPRGATGVAVRPVRSQRDLLTQRRADAAMETITRWCDLMLYEDQFEAGAILAASLYDQCVGY